MSTRERWIVYPLVFLTLGIALRDKILPSRELRARQIVCDRLECNRARCNRSECNTLLVEGPQGRPVVVAGTDVSNQAGVVETFTVNGFPQVRLFSGDAGGAVTTIDHAGRVMLMMGYFGQNFGLFAQIPQLGAPIPLTLPLRFEPRPSPGQPSKGSAAPGKSPEKQSPKKEIPSGSKPG